jgi:protein TonB
VSATGIRLVARLGPISPRTRWFVGSLAFHVSFAVVLAFWPAGSRASRGPIGPRIAVDLVGALPGAKVSAPVNATPPAPKAAEAKPKPKPVEEKPKAAALETRKVEVTKKPAPREPEPEAVEPEPLPGAGAADDTASTAPESGTEAAGGGDGGVVGDVGGGSLLGSEHAWYGARVTAALRANWRRPPLGNVREPLTVMVAFDILRTGAVRNPRIVESSGVPSLDRSALRAVVDAQPLPALPRGLTADVVPARFEFTWSPGDS